MMLQCALSHSGALKAAAGYCSVLVALQGVELLRLRGKVDLLAMLLRVAVRIASGIADALMVTATRRRADG